MSESEIADLQDDIFAGGGEVRALCRELDWAATPLGPPAHWPDALRTIVRTCLDAPFPINLWCGDALTLIYNDGYATVLGAKHPGALGRPGPEVWAEIWPQIHSMFENIGAGGPAVYADDAPFVVQRTGEVRLPDSGPNAWFTFSLSPVRGDDGRVVAFLNVVSETTRRLQAERSARSALAAAEAAEARLRDVFAQAPAFLAVLRGQDHVFEYVNEAYYQLVGRRDLLGRRAFDVLSEMRSQGFERLLDGVLKTGVPFVGREVPVRVLRGVDGESEERFLDLVYYPIREPDGTRSGVVAHGSDVTDHVRARHEAQRARADAELANQAKSHFLATMSHEIRTPINAVIGYADLLDAGIAGELEERQQEFVSRIRSSSAHLLSLVNDVLDLSKIEAGELTVAMQQTPVSGIVAAAIDMVAAQAGEKRIRVHNHCDPALPVSVLGDEDRVRQVLLNLLSNAVKFSAEGGRVDVLCTLHDRAADGLLVSGEGSWAVVEVVDHGVGIAADQLEAIFDPFVQVEQRRAHRSAGTGLGLTISRNLARLMGGDLAVQSTPGKGSRFALWLRATGN